LRNLNLPRESIPLEELRTYLTAKYETRFQIDPHVFEDAVAAVFKDLGFGARAVGRHRGDGGIDVILEGPNDEMIGVQVKRYRHKIKADYIRSLVGALILNDMTAGMFVTTSDFEPAAREAARHASLRGLPVELVNAPDFYDRLKITQCVAYDSIMPFWEFKPAEIDSWDVARIDPSYLPHELRVA
jgi:restriction system protein